MTRKAWFQGLKTRGKDEGKTRERRGKDEGKTRERMRHDSHTNAWQPLGSHEIKNSQHTRTTIGHKRAQEPVKSLAMMVHSSRNRRRLRTLASSGGMTLASDGISMSSSFAFEAAGALRAEPPPTGARFSPICCTHGLSSSRLPPLLSLPRGSCCEAWVRTVH